MRHLLAQPAQRAAEIDFLRAANLNLRRDGAQLASAGPPVARRVVRMMIGEKPRWKTLASGLTLPERLTMMRRLNSARPRRKRRRRYLAGPGPRVTGLESTVRAPAITASAVARSWSRCSWSRRLPNEETRRLAVAIFPSAVIAMLTRTKGKGVEG